MAANRLTGKDGKVTHNLVDVPITLWNLNINMETQEITDSDDAAIGFSTHQPNGWTDWDGTFEGWVEDGTLGLVVGVEDTLVLDHGGGATYTGEAIITGKAPANEIKGEAAKDVYTFQGTGLLTIANPL